MRKIKEQDWDIEGVIGMDGYMDAQKEGDDEYGGGTTRPPPDKKP